MNGNGYIKTLGNPLEEVSKEFVLAAIKGHMIAPELHRILSHDIPDLAVKEDDSETDSIRVLVEPLFNDRKAELRSDLNIPLAAKIVTKSIKYLVREAVLFEPELFQLGDFSQELVQFMMAYLTKLPSGG